MEKGGGTEKTREKRQKYDENERRVSGFSLASFIRPWGGWCENTKRRLYRLLCAAAAAAAAVAAVVVAWFCCCGCRLLWLWFLCLL